MLVSWFLIWLDRSSLNSGAPTSTLRYRIHLEVLEGPPWGVEVHLNGSEVHLKRPRSTLREKLHLEWRRSIHRDWGSHWETGPLDEVPWSTSSKIIIWYSGYDFFSSSVVGLLRGKSRRLRDPFLFVNNSLRGESLFLWCDVHRVYHFRKW